VLETAQLETAGGRGTWRMTVDQLSVAAKAARLEPGRLHQPVTLPITATERRCCGRRSDREQSAGPPQPIACGGSALEVEHRDCIVPYSASLITSGPP
jgi:hypothetical protein